MISDYSKINSTMDVINALFGGVGTFVEIHKLRSVGPTLLNRDGNGNAKTIQYGGFTRTVVSSQCRKAAIRAKETEIKTYRTRYVGRLVKEQVAADNPNAVEEYLVRVDEIVQDLFGGPDGDKGRIKIVTSVGAEDINRIAKEIVKYYPINAEDIKVTKGRFDKKDKRYSELETKLRSLIKSSQVDYDIAMFGRMSTNTVIQSVDSAAFYNFAYTTNVSASDSDYFIAQDTFRKTFEDISDNGAGHLDERDINAGCYYSYAGIALTTFVENIMKGINFEDKEQVKIRLRQAIDYLCDVIEKTITVMPTAMQHQMASFPDPECVYMTIKSGAQNVTYDKAFEKPVYSDRNHSVAEKSVDRLVSQINNNKFDTADYKAKYWIGDDEKAPEGAISTNLRQMLKGIKEYFYEQVGA